MTLRLLLMRHGKSDWDADFKTDHDRPIAPRGEHASRKIGELLQKGKQLPTQILCSTALRARETTHYFLEGAQQSIPVEFISEFYGSSPNVVFRRIQQEFNQSPLMIVGHEPVWSALAGQLIGGGAIAFPTAAIARIDFEIFQWSQISMGSGELRWLLQPKLFTSG